MAYDFVDVAFSLAFLGTGLPYGSLTFEPSDFVMDTQTGELIIVPPVILNYTGGAIPGPVVMTFLATDSQNVSPGWSWILTAELSDRKRPLPVRAFEILFANGAEQPFAAIAATSTIVT